MCCTFCTKFCTIFSHFQTTRNDGSCTICQGRRKRKEECEAGNIYYIYVLYCTVLYCIVLYCTVLYCTDIVLYCTDIVLYCTVLYCIVLYCTVLYCTVLYCTVLYCTVLYCTVLYRAILYCTTIYLNVQYWPAPPTIHRGLEWPQFLNSLIVLCLFVCSLSACKQIFSISFISFHFIHSRICCIGVSFISISKIFAVLAPYTQNIAQGKKNDSRINAVYSGSLHPALHRNGA